MKRNNTPDLHKIWKQEMKRISREHDKLVKVVEKNIPGNLIPYMRPDAKEGAARMREDMRKVASAYKYLRLWVEVLR